MAFKGLFILLVVVFTNCVTSKEARYNFNHPPLAEYSNPIPVAVVHDDKNAFTLRSEITTKPSNEDKNVETEGATEVNTSTESKQLNTVSAESVDNKAQTSKSKARALSDLQQIPVAVVYDSDPNIYLNYQRTRSSTVSPKRHLNNIRKQQIKTNTDEQTTENIEKIEQTESNVGRKIFKKRTEGRDPIVPIVESESYVFSHNGNFHYRYEGGDGTKAYSEGKLKKVEDEIGEAVVGGFSYTDKDGNDFSLSYTADENGYRPVGAHLPTPPPIPPEIARALAYLATATPAPTTVLPVKKKSPVK